MLSPEEAVHRAEIRLCCSGHFNDAERAKIRDICAGVTDECRRIAQAARFVQTNPETRKQMGAPL
jgi:hypothetical protein